MQDFEILGLFYLGRSYDVATRKSTDSLVLYDSRDLVTHAVCVGMTGSGKTGLCLSLIEEAAIDHVPVIAIDPKGDLSNLLLTFPQLRDEDFAPWVDEGEAKKQGISTTELAEKQAAVWKKGLGDWGQDGARVQRLKDSADFRIYTPGSQAGIPISIIKSFAAPDQAIRDDAELFNERVATAVTSLLGLLGIDADPSQSREHILISSILASAWKAGTNLDIPALIAQVQTPRFRQVGVIDVDSFFPAKDRFALALRLNNLIASPGFDTWTKGEPLDVSTLLHGPGGKPRISIISIAHLADAERMFFVSLLLNEVLGWARAQQGTSSLRAILYMDEIFGYFPPIASPPSKRPLLTLLKQARAFGLGVMLATQNPADLDYKGLSNTGTWFIGRLQAERDKLRVLDGLEGAAAAQNAQFNRQELDTLLSGLAQRTFLLHNVHEDKPQVFQVRWAMSFLRGPISREQIKQLMDPLKATSPDPSVPAATSAPTAPPSAAAAPSTVSATASRPLVPPEVPQYFIPLRGKTPDGGSLVYRPGVLGIGDVYFNDTKSGASATESVSLMIIPGADERSIDWAQAETVDFAQGDLETDASAAGQYAALPPCLGKPKSVSAWTKGFVDALYRQQTLSLLRSPRLGTWSKPGESERDFRVRLQQAAKEARDAQLDLLRAKYAPKLSALEDKIRRAEQAAERESSQARTAGFSSLINLGTTVMSAILGRKAISATTINKAGTAARSLGKTWKESDDAGRARESVESLRQQHADLEAEFHSESESLAQRIDPLTESLESVALKPKKSNITPKLVAVVWIPFWAQADGSTAAAH
jgi:hypothetical protein